MTAALVLLGAALLSWPGSPALRRTRRLAATGGRGRIPVPVPRLPRPVLWGAGAAAVAALLSTPLVAVLAGAAAVLAARTGDRRRAGVREEARLTALAEALAALAAELRSGRSLTEATAAAVAACADEESGRALAGSVVGPRAGPDPGGRTGTEVEQALQRVSAAAALSRRTGCSLASVLGAVEDDLRARSRQRQDLRSLTAGPRASAALLAGLPLLALGMGSGIGADPWRVLTTTATGQVLLVLGVALEGAGLAWSARLVRRAVR
ncbi:type II secretion system F family protein [Geodermatophilus sabuli]|uniref:Tight adherence protein B n=1 Tax=Geodermatophilus sabuli TaxID=1564158 RepID=A0A285ECH0_9ACTN|nr:type II secretion system F family protein [Geodermatophilus sabuli]MBB3083448.1 tight adherence protein B [Geodermatophilus sabuli]SNX96832.1 tight adherence protein B [Geodermatophilus sabuli]